MSLVLWPASVGAVLAATILISGSITTHATAVAKFDASQRTANPVYAAVAIGMKQAPGKITRMLGHDHLLHRPAYRQIEPDHSGDAPAEGAATVHHSARGDRAARRLHAPG